MIGPQFLGFASGLQAAGGSVGLALEGLQLLPLGCLALAFLVAFGLA